MGVHTSTCAASLRNILLLTATVQPPADVRSLVRRDPRVRLADYLGAFEFYLDELRAGSADSLVLCENSGFSLSCFEALARQRGLQDRVECISFCGLDHPGRYGRGYGEFKLVDQAMATSSLIALGGRQAVVWKVTGRYQVRNIAALIRSRPAHADLYCNAHNWPRPYIDLYTMGWTRAGHEDIVSGLHDSLRQDNSPKSAERRFREVIDGHPCRARIVLRFRHVPLIDGIRAGDNRDFRDARARYVVRVLALRLMPGVWL
jgi:hypothetical protein